MARNKIDYGIDLGTTNSAIARIEAGEPVIKKSDTSMDTMPSCVGVDRRKAIRFGLTAWNTLKSDKLSAMRTWDASGYNTFIEFKRTMGTDKTYRSAHMDREYDSEELSAEVLKALRSFISDEDFRSVVVTVPAKFDIRQKDATLRAAKMAGFQHCELLQEPIAASMSYGLDSKSKNGFWVVFDFGGGTFDAALVKVEEGIMQVKDTDGDIYLGGKNLDMAIVDEIIIPYLEERFAMDSIMADENKRTILQEAMKYFAEEAKIQLSFKEEHNILSDLGQIPGTDDDGEEFELDITVTRASLKKVVAPIFQRAIDITQKLLKRNNLTGGQLDALILVGGPTFSPILREMLEAQIAKPDTSADPMTAVAVGAALYASTIDVSEDVREATRDKAKVQLELGYAPSTVENEEWVTFNVRPDKTEGEIPKEVFIEMVRSDKAWSSGKIAAGEKPELAQVLLNEGKTNSFGITLYDGAGNRIPCEPSSFNIIQGSVIGSATLPYYIGVEVERGRDGRHVFASAKGLEVNVNLPAKGVLNGLKTQSQIRPGNSTDSIRISVYQADHGSDGSRAVYNELVYSIELTGDDFPALLPENSDLDITLTTDKSGRIEKIQAYFPYLDYTAEIAVPYEQAKEIGAEYLEEELSAARGSLRDIRQQGHTPEGEVKIIEEELDYLTKQLEQGRSDSNRKSMVLNRLRESLKNIDRILDSVEWPQLEAELRDEFAKLERAQNDLGNERSAAQVRQLRNQLDEVIRTKDEKVGQALLEDISGLFFALTYLYQLIGFIDHHSENFSDYNWRNPQRARQVIRQAEENIADGPVSEFLRPLVKELFDLLPPTERPSGPPVPKK
jgi:molecular chaperone DnaK